MEGFAVRIVCVFLLWLPVVIGLFICVFKNFTVYNDAILKKILKIFIVSQLLASIWNLTGFLTSTIAGGWVLGDFMCQTFGFMNLVVTSGSVWVMAVVAIERYHRFLVVLDHPSTFSARNVNIMTCGIYILVVLLSSGPLYGLGEYSYFRGHVNLQVTLELYMNNQSETAAPANAIMTYLTSIQDAVKQGKMNDVTDSISEHFQANVGVVTRSMLMPQGLMIIIRSPDRKGIDTLWTKYSNNSIKQLLHSVLWIPNIGHKCGFTDMKITTSMDQNQLTQYTTIYQEAQEIGMCSVDYTSFNSHAIIWSGYQLIISSILPYVIILVCYITIYSKHPRAVMILDKTVNEDDIFVLNWFCSASIICFIVTFIYHVVILVNANGTFISSDIVFAVSYIYYGDGIFCLICLLFANKCHCKRMKPNCKMLCYCPDEESAYELSDLSLRNETTEILSQTSLRHPSYV